jgi:hypothetical protein
MRPSFRCGTIILALIASASALMLGTGFVRSGANADSDADDAAVSADAGVSVAALMPSLFVPRGRQPMAPLSDEERAQVFDGVMRMPDVPVADVEPPEEAAPVPVAAELQDLPIGVAQQIPRIEGYKFVKLDDRVLLVHPRSRKVVAEMPRYKLVLQ